MGVFDPLREIRLKTQQPAQQKGPLELTMQVLSLESAAFEDAGLGVNGTRAGDGSALSILFKHLAVSSSPASKDLAPQVLRAKGRVRCIGSGWVKLDMRGACLSSGPASFAHALAWADDSPLHLLPDRSDAPLCSSALVRIEGGKDLQLHLTLLAQRDPTEANSEALCVVDSIDIKVLAARSLQGQPYQTWSASK